MVALLVVLARPVGRQRVAWLGVVAALAGAVSPAAGPDPEALAEGLEAHCREMLATTASLAEDERLTRLFTVTGEVLNPAMPFEVLDAEAARMPNRTIYLADDRGRLVAWGGAERAYPERSRPLGPRAWGVEWSAARGVLHLREPLIIEGRIVGSVTIADLAKLRAGAAWGMRAPRGRRLVLGAGVNAATEVSTDVAPGVVLGVGSGAVPRAEQRMLFELGWALVFVTGLVFRPRWAWAAVLAAVAISAVAAIDLNTAERMVLVLGAGAAIGRLGRQLPTRWAAVLACSATAGAIVVRLFGPGAYGETWLPDHLLRPGWGGVWIIAMAWVAAAWPGSARRRLQLERRVLVAGGLAVLALLVDLAWIPLQIVGANGDATGGVVLPRREVEASAVWPAAAAACRLDDAAPVLAERWGLQRWATPSRLSLVDDEGWERSSWGDLSPAGDRIRMIRRWIVAGATDLHFELYVATHPWSLLGDWSSGDPLEDVWRRSVWYAVLTRSGTVAATLHPEIRDLDPAAAGEAYHAGVAWTRIRVGDARLPARVERKGEWLVAAVAHPPEPPVWVVRTALALVWAFLGSVLARPPRFRREEIATFGGRLRLLVAGGVVIPLVILTLFLQLRLGREETRFEEVLGLDALEAARYTVEHLGEGVIIDDQLAAWLAGGWGGEVVFFDQTTAVGVSRPDLMSVGRLDQLPAVEAYPAYMLGRSDAVVAHRSGWVAASGAVSFEDRRYLLQLYRSDLLRSGDAPDAVDWLLTGGLLAAILALIATGRIEERLSVSLRDLVELARRLVRGDPVGPLRRPRETDLAEVLDAVSSMNEEVRRRELSLRHQEELLRITLANLVPAVMVLKPDGELMFANPSAEALIEEHGEVVRERVRGLAAGIGDAAEDRVTAQPYPGRDLTWRIGVAKAPLPDGRKGVVAVIDDVTEVVRLDRLRQLNQLARIVAHEVKNPLTPVRLWVQELSEARRRGGGDLDELVEEACGEIEHQVRRLQDTANSFSNLVALEHWQPEPIDLGVVVASATEGFGVLARRGITIRTELPETGSAIVTADRQWMTRALSNLIQNSLDVIGDGPGEIGLRVDAGADRVLLEVEDSGGGVAADQLQDLFSPHFSTTASGSGLGLALVHQVVTRCQGTVRAANGERGLRITIELPSARGE